MSAQGPRWHHERPRSADHSDGRWVPTEANAAAARLTVGALCPRADQVTLELHDEVRFIDQGANFESIRCPACRAEPGLSWWRDQMDRAHERQFADLTIITPCCAAATSLNELDYHWPAGFARFELIVLNPGRGWLTAGEITDLADTIDHPLRQVFSHH